MNIKVILNYVLLLFIFIGLSGCNDNDVGKTLTYADIAVTFSGNTSGAVNEADGTATGTVTVSGDSIVAQTDVAQTYGSFSIDSSGQWTYTLQDANAAVQALNAGETVTESVEIVSAAGNISTITITVTGANNVAVLGGVNTGTVASNSTTAIEEALSLTDPDSTPDTFVAQTDSASTYGTFTIDEVGAWSYTVDTANTAVAALTTGSMLTDVIAVATVDGLTDNITITINGAAANTPATFSGDIASSIDAGDMTTLAGTVIVTDPDTGENVIVAQASGALMYGSFSIGTDGVWSYLLDNSNAEVQALTVGSTLTEDAAIASADSTAGAVTITINGTVPAANKYAVIRDTTGDTGELRYDVGAPQLSGRLDVTYDRSAAGTDAFISLLNSTGSTSSGRSIVDMRIKAGEFQFRDQTFAIAAGVVPTPGTPQTVVITWTAPDAATPPTVTVTVDGVNVVDGGGSFTSAAAGIGGVERVQFRYGSNANVYTSADTFTIEEWEVFSDTAGTTSLFADDFSTYTVGNSLDPNATDTDATATVQADTPYHSSSNEVVVEEK